MRSFTLAVCLIPLLGACKTCDDDVASDIDANLVSPIDAAPVDAEPVDCDPLAAAGAQGCDAGDKCTWVGNAGADGALGCVPAGGGGDGEACARVAAGYDDCEAGLICVDGTCNAICGFDASSACDTGSCVRFDEMFANGGDDPVLGACRADCNPITQTCGAGDGCYLVTSATDTLAVCAPAGNGAHNQDLTGAGFANSCVPGAQVRRKDASSTTLQCGGLCNPVDVTLTTNMASEAGQEIAGNATAKDNCETSWGANPPDSSTAGESCRFWWSREPFADLSGASNTVGYCFKHAVFQYDSNGDMTPDMPFPRCTTLTTGDVVPPIGNPPHNDARYFRCVAQPATIAGQDVATSGEPVLDRLTGWR